MPHSYLELNAMSEEQLRSIAESLGIKDLKKMDKADVGFANDVTCSIRVISVCLLPVIVASLSNNQKSPYNL